MSKCKSTPKRIANQLPSLLMFTYTYYLQCQHQEEVSKCKSTPKRIATQLPSLLMLTYTYYLQCRHQEECLIKLLIKALLWFQTRYKNGENQISVCKPTLPFNVVMNVSFLHYGCVEMPEIFKIKIKINY